MDDAISEPVGVPAELLEALAELNELTPSLRDHPELTAPSIESRPPDHHRP